MHASNHSTIGVFTDHNDAEAAVRALQASGFDMKQLSIMGKGYHTEESVVGYYNMGDRMLAWGRTGAFWGWIWGLLFGSAFFLIPGIGPVMVGGPIIAWVVGALETAAVVGGVSALGGALTGLGVPDDTVLRYETALKADRFVLIAHGDPAQVEAAQAVLLRHKAVEANVHGRVLSDNVVVG